MNPVLNKTDPVLNKMDPVLNKTDSVLNKMDPVLFKTGYVLNMTKSVINKAGFVLNISLHASTWRLRTRHAQDMHKIAMLCLRLLFKYILRTIESGSLWYRYLLD